MLRSIRVLVLVRVLVLNLLFLIVLLSSKEVVLLLRIIASLVDILFKEELALAKVLLVAFRFLLLFKEDPLKLRVLFATIRFPFAPTIWRDVNER